MSELRTLEIRKCDDRHVYRDREGDYGTQNDGTPAEPLATVVGKARHALVTVVIDGETYVVTDIAMRMLTPRELARCQGFEDDYLIDRTADGLPVTKADQVKLIGNSVPPQFIRALAGANVAQQGVLDEQPIQATGGAA